MVILRLRLHGGGGGKGSSRALNAAQQRAYEMDMRRQELARKESALKERKEKAELSQRQGDVVDRRKAIRQRARSLFAPKSGFDL